MRVSRLMRRIGRVMARNYAAWRPRVDPTLAPYPSRCIGAIRGRELVPKVTPDFLMAFEERVQRAAREAYDATNPIAQMFGSLFHK